jgi:nucleoside 2-deoxyribosyltransferase
MAKAIRDSGHEVTSPWVLGALDSSNPSALNVFERDRSGVERSDAIVADVTEPSIGVGMEIMAAYKAGRRIIIVAKKGRVTSRMLQHMDNKETVEYEDESEIYGGLRRLLGQSGRGANLP